MKRVLVTGSNGQLGRCMQQVVQEEELQGYEFVFTDSKTLDITNAEVVEDYFFSNRIDFCVNCAAYTAVDKAEDEVEEAFLVNADGVRNLAQACQDHQVTLIQISTDYVFDGRKDSPYFPKDETNPINVYGKSKLLGEQYALKCNEKTIVIRTSWVYSEYGSNFVLTMRRLFTEREEISIVADQVGRPTDALKLARYIVNDVIVKNDTNYGIRHFASEPEMSWYEFGLRIKEEMGSGIEIKPISTEEYPTKAVRPRNSVLGEGDENNSNKRVDVKPN